MTDHPLPLIDKGQLADLLGESLRTLHFWFYALPKERRYVAFEISRGRDREPRVIHAPIPPIKRIQRRLLAHLVPCYRAPAPAHAYIAGRSILSNAADHVDKEWLLRVDVQDFFPSIHFGRVRGLFLAAPFSYSHHVATMLANICCHEGRLPQGAPTSPLVSNMICLRLDRRLMALCKDARANYSRYCDDLVFSTNKRSFPEGLAAIERGTGTVAVGRSLEAILGEEGFSANRSKTRLRRYSQRQIVTGLVVNDGINVPRDRIRDMRSLLYIWRRYGLDAAQRSFAQHHVVNHPPGKPLPSFPLTVRGHLQYIGSIKGWYSPTYQGLGRRLRHLDPAFVQTSKDSDQPAVRFQLFVEGPSDQLHIEKAFTVLRASGQFKSIMIEFPRRDRAGDSDLLDLCRHMRQTKQNPPIVVIFDSDNPKTVKKVQDGEKPKHWGNQVFSLALPTPAHRVPGEPLCIELLYPDDVLARQAQDGRRLYLRSEFDERTGKHRGGTAHAANIRKALVIEEGVSDFQSGRPLALSKTAFARMIARQEIPFADIAFDGFIPLFESLKSIRRELLTSS